jgi:hypothetical protein
MTAEQPRRIDPERCGCDECWNDVSVPLDRATWQQVKAMLAGQIEDATGTELVAEVRVWPKVQAAWSDGHQWVWKYDQVAAPDPVTGHFHDATGGEPCTCPWPGTYAPQPQAAEEAPDA